MRPNHGKINDCITLKFCYIFLLNAEFCEQRPGIILSDLQTDLESVDMWCENNNIVLDLQKTKNMLISSKHTRATLKLSISNRNISQVRSEKLLGIIVDDRLNFDKQIQSFSKQLNQNFHIKKNKEIFTTPCKTNSL